MATEAGQVIDDILEFLWRENPVEATIAGIHRYDDMLEKLDQVSRRKKLEKKREYLEQLESLKVRGKLAAEVQHLKCALRVGINMEVDFSSLDRDATTYPRLALYGVYQLVARSNAPYHFRALRAIDRLREIPRVLTEGRLNLSYGGNLPHILTIRAVEISARGRDYLARITGILSREVPELENVIGKYSSQALKAFEDFVEFLIEEAQPRSDGVCAAGEDIFDFLLKHEHQLDLNTGSLRKLAEEEVDRALARLEETAAGISGSKDWRSALARDSELPAADNLLEHWRGIINEVAGRVRSAGLVTLPSGGKLEIVQTPEFETSILPVAGYIEPPHFESEAIACFCVTQPADEDRERLLPAHSRVNALATAIRQVYPGRHTFLVQRRRHCGERLAYLARGSVLEAGWESYILGATIGSGAFDDEQLLNLLNHHGRLLAALRVLIDLDIHTGGMKEERAVNELAGRAAISEKQAWQVVSALAAAPASSVGALAGRLMIEKWCGKFRKALGKEFSLKDFHDRLIRASGLPPKSAEKKLSAALGREKG
ncbi:MAG: DUF885 domain-containing protein [Candidatus Glassbacteria bacterium]|nr:DUF885 domain-containing protein [Candidatus Glassbacteria bacterium]